MSDWDSEQVDIWNRFYQEVADLLAKYGIENPIGDGDYWINEDNYGWRRISVGVQNLSLFRPEVVTALRGLLDAYPDWEIAVAVDVLGTEKSWPLMGVTIRKREIVDGLQRQYLPEEFRRYQYADSRPGTGYD